MWDGVILDTTRMKQSELAAAAAAASTRDVIIESISQGIVIFDPDDRLVTWNSHFLDLYPGLVDVIAVGVDYDEVLRAEVEQGMEEDEAKDGMLSVRLEQHAGDDATVERRLRDDRWILIKERRTAEGGTIILYTDVSDLKRREEQLRGAKTLAETANVKLERTNRRLDIALENMSQGLCLFDADQRLVLSNRRYAAIFWLPEQLTQPGVTIREQMQHRLKRGDPATATEEMIGERLRQAASRRRGVYRLDLPGGRIVEVFHQPLPDGGAVETFADVTDQSATQQALADNEERLRERVGELLETRRRLELQGRKLQSLAVGLGQARDEAQAANRSRSEFLANISHELRTPLNAIIGFSEAMTTEIFGPLGDQRYRGHAEDINQSGRHLLDMIDEILDLSKLDAGKFELRESDVDLNGVLSACGRLMRHRAADAGLDLTVDVPSAGWQVRADESKLRQILFNLLTNAVKFTPAGGKIVVTADAAENGGIDLTVTDTGVGMDPDHIPPPLEPFQSDQGAGSRQHAGTGPGLPLVKSLIELHDGSLRLTSAKGTGTTATIHIPGSRVIGEHRTKPSG